MDKRKNIANLNIPLASLAVFLIIWEIMDRIFSFREIILPNPHEIFFAIINNWNILVKNVGITMFESVFGFIIGSIIGILAAVLFVYSRTSKKALYPYAIALMATPLYALAPLLVVWFGSGYLSKIIMSALVAFFPVLVSCVKGLTAVEQEKLDLFKSLYASKWNIFMKLRFPNSLPYLFSGLRTASTLAVVGATVAEFTGSSAGIGHLIVNSSYYLNTSLMFAGIIMISLSGILFFYTIRFVEKKTVFWQEVE